MLHSFSLKNIFWTLYFSGFCSSLPRERTLIALKLQVTSVLRFILQSHVIANTGAPMRTLRVENRSG